MHFCSLEHAFIHITVISCENPVLTPCVPVFCSFSPADPGREGSSGWCRGGRLGGVHRRRQCRGHDPCGGTKQDQSSNRLPQPHPQQVSRLAVHDATKHATWSLTLHFYLGQTQQHKSPQNTYPPSFWGEIKYHNVLEICLHMTDSRKTHWF